MVKISALSELSLSVHNVFYICHFVSWKNKLLNWVYLISSQDGAHSKNLLEFSIDHVSKEAGKMATTLYSSTDPHLCSYHYEHLHTATLS